MLSIELKRLSIGSYLHTGHQIDEIVINIFVNEEATQAFKRAQSFFTCEHAIHASSCEHSKHAGTGSRKQTKRLA